MRGADGDVWRGVAASGLRVCVLALLMHHSCAGGAASERNSAVAPLETITGADLVTRVVASDSMWILLGSSDRCGEPCNTVRDVLASVNAKLNGSIKFAVIDVFSVCLGPLQLLLRCTFAR